MPMDFPDMKSLIDAAKVHKFRPPEFGELEKDYRAALAAHVRPFDRIESIEIACGYGSGPVFRKALQQDLQSPQ